MPYQASNRFISLTGAVSQSRRVGSGSGSTGSDATLDQLADAIRRLGNRVSELESNRAPFWTEFEVSCPASGTVTIRHNFGCPVRFFVTNWRSSTADPPVLRESPDSTVNTLVLDSENAGRAVVRVEQSAYSLTPGNG